MTTIVLRPTITSVDPGVGLVGGGDALADDTDSTYVSIPVAVGQGVHLAFPAATLPVDINYVATFSSRGYLTSGIAAQTDLVALSSAAYTTGTTTSSTPADMEPTELPATPLDFYYAELIDGLSGLLVNTAEAESTVVVTELSLTIVYGGGLFPLRRYPPVGNGGHGPTRHWPRTVNRRAGGSY